MRITELSSCFVTREVGICRSFYRSVLGAQVEFDNGGYLSLRFGAGGPAIQFMLPQEGMAEYGGGVTLNVKVADVDREHTRLVKAGLTITMALADHPWGDRGFALSDPLGTSIYLYEDREPAEEFKQYYSERPAWWKGTGVGAAGAEAPGTEEAIVFSGRASEADCVRILLEGQGIRAWLRDEHMGILAPYYSAAGAYAVKVVVMAGDAQRAAELLESARQEPKREDWVCPQCQETIEGQFAECWQCGAARVDKDE